MQHYDRAVVIGRFQPLHNGHLTAINKALEIADQVVILVGSARSPRTIKNPFTFDERSQMIRSVYGDRVHIAPLADFKYDDTAWIAEVRRRVTAAVPQKIGVGVSGPELHGYRTAIVGLNKDDTTYYLNILSPWTLVEHSVDQKIDATKVREIFLDGWLRGFIDGVVPSRVRAMLEEFAVTEEYKILAREMMFLRKYRQQYVGLQHPPTHYTADALVVQSGHVLLVERGDDPGKGLLALPGGFVQQTETAFNAAVRELYEETGLKVQEKILRDKLVSSRVFDAPDRDLRGRIVTVAHLFRLDDETKLPKVKGADDAASARWVPLEEFVNMEPRMYSDHFHIVRVMLLGFWAE